MQACALFMAACVCVRRATDTICTVLSLHMACVISNSHSMTVVLISLVFSVVVHLSGFVNLSIFTPTDTITGNWTTIASISAAIMGISTLFSKLGCLLVLPSIKSNEFLRVSMRSCSTALLLFWLYTTTTSSVTSLALAPTVSRFLEHFNVSNPLSDCQSSLSQPFVLSRNGELLLPIRMLKAACGSCVATRASRAHMPSMMFMGDSVRVA